LKQLEKKHEIAGVVEGSIAHEMELEVGDFLVSINGKQVKDILHYRFLTQSVKFVMEIEKSNGESWELDIEKDPFEEMGLVFALPLLRPTMKCKNKCVFCFVDQQPKGLRASLYVKDDDPIESFFNGNYITLNNLTDEDVKRIAHYHLSPLRISVHSTDVETRNELMGGNASKIMSTLKTFSDANIEMHFQMVLCKGINDVVDLIRAPSDLRDLPGAKSLAIVPAGITKHREGLYKLEQFDKDEVRFILESALVKGEGPWVHNKEFSVYFADEFYILGDLPLPSYESYKDFPQLDNGVGVIRLFEREFNDAMEENKPSVEKINIGIITGKAAEKFMEEIATTFILKNPGFNIEVYAIKNDFFGELITVSGLLTGQDIITQLKGKVKEDLLFIPDNAFRDGTEIMLDETTLEDLSKALGVEVRIGSTNGEKFCKQLLDIKKFAKQTFNNQL